VVEQRYRAVLEVQSVLRRLMAMRGIRLAANADAARCLLRADVDWWELVRYGPPGFDVYVRIAFAQDADGAAAGLFQDAD
jgi:hypothetical protein